MINNFFKDKKFFLTLLFIAIPIILQFLLNSSLNFLDVFMIGQLGENEVAAVGIGTQIYFVFIMLVFGITSGVSIFTSQYWGTKNIIDIKKIMRIGFIISLIISTIFISSILIFPKFFINLFSKDINVISLAKDYLIIVVFSFILFSFTTLYSMVLRSTEKVILPMAAGITGVILNTLLNFLLIFGNFGFPKLGVKGAAIATLIARVIELSIILFFTYLWKLPASINPFKIFNFQAKMLKKYIFKTAPIILQTLGWSIGYSMYSMIYGHISTKALASYNISCSIERICLILFIGLGQASSIMVGNKIGENKEKKAFEYSSKFLIITFIFSIIISLILFIIRNPVSEIYKLSDISRNYISNILLVMSIIMWSRAFNIIFHAGIFKAGGDTLFSMIIDVGGIWIIGIPIAAVTGLVFKQAVYIVFLFAATEEIVKAVLGFIRYFSKKWLNNLVENKNNEKEILLNEG